MANPNPSPETRFGVGSNPNPQGKTSEQKRNEMRAAEIATRMRLAELEAQERAFLETGQLPGVSSDNLRLWKDAEDRGLGSPTQPIESKHDVSDAMNEAMREFTSKLARVSVRRGAGPDTE